MPEKLSQDLCLKPSDRICIDVQTVDQFKQFCLECYCTHYFEREDKELIFIKSNIIRGNEYG